MKNRILHTVLLLVFAIAVQGQNQYLSANDNDPKATKILDQLKSSYKALKSVEMTFTMKMNIPEQGEEVQKGKIFQKGNKYAVIGETQSIYNNGESVWMHLIENNEVQISDAEEDESGLLTPESIMNLYEEEKMVYAITDYPVENGVKLTRIDFKPQEQSSEYAKMSIFVDTKKEEIKAMDIVNKDGSRYVMTIDEIKKNVPMKDAIFDFDESKYPDIYVEDLRLD